MLNYFQFYDILIPGDNKMTIYDRIRALRISQKMSQTDLAIKLGYKDGSMITKIESGKVDISQKKIFAFAKALNTTPSYLMGLSDFAKSDISMDDPNESILLSCYRSLSPHGKTLLLERCEELKLLYGKKSESDSAESV